LDFGPAVGLQPLTLICIYFPSLRHCRYRRTEAPRIFTKSFSRLSETKRKKVDDNVVDAAESVVEEGARSSWTDGVASRRPITRTRRAVRHRNCSALWALGMDLRAVWRCGLAAGQTDGRTRGRTDARPEALACGPGPGYGNRVRGVSVGRPWQERIQTGVSPLFNQA
jgi:hypothetical protein